MAGWEDLTLMLGPTTGRAEVVTAADMNSDAAAKLAEEFSLPTHYADVHEMFEKETLDIVSITTWQSVRAETHTDCCRGRGVRDYR